MIEAPTLVFNTRSTARRKMMRSSGSKAYILRSQISGGNGAFIDFQDQSLCIGDSTTQSNVFSGQFLSKGVFSRASTATRIDATGNIINVASDEMRTFYDPATLAFRGLLIEGARQNLLLNTDVLSTQSVTVTAAAHTLSFYGTGTVTLSGAATATVNGTGVYPTQTVSTFTPTAGSLTLTVTGSVTFAQLELGSIQSSYIRNTDTANTRAPEICSLATSLFPASATGPYTVYCTGYMPPVNAADITRIFFGLSNGTSAERRYAQRTGAGAISPGNITASVNNYALTTASLSSFAFFKLAVRFQQDNANFALNGSVPGADDTVCADAAAPTILNIGNTLSAGTGYFHGWIRQLAVMPVALNNSQLATLTT